MFLSVSIQLNGGPWMTNEREFTPVSTTEVDQLDEARCHFMNWAWENYGRDSVRHVIVTPAIKRKIAYRATVLLTDGGRLSGVRDFETIRQNGERQDEEAESYFRDAAEQKLGKERIKRVQVSRV